MSEHVDAASLAPSHKNIHAAKLGVMREVTYIQKTRAPGLNYSFTSESEMLERLQPALVKHGLTMCPAEITIIEARQYQTTKGAPMNSVRLLVKYRLTHAASDTGELIQAIGEAADSGDKACPKAMTCAIKYALRQSFLLATGDDPDRYATEPEAPPEPPVRPEPSPLDRARASIPLAQDGNRLEKLRDRYVQVFTQDKIEELDVLWARQWKALLNSADIGACGNLNQAYLNQHAAHPFATLLDLDLNDAYDRRWEELEGPPPQP